MEADSPPRVRTAPHSVGERSPAVRWPPMLRLPALRSPVVRSPMLRSPEVCSPVVRSPVVRSPERAVKQRAVKQRAVKQRALKGRAVARHEARSGARRARRFEEAGSPAVRLRVVRLATEAETPGALTPRLASGSASS